MSEAQWNPCIRKPYTSPLPYRSIHHYHYERDTTPWGLKIFPSGFMKPLIFSLIFFPIRTAPFMISTYVLYELDSGTTNNLKVEHFGSTCSSSKPTGQRYYVSPVWLMRFLLLPMIYYQEHEVYESESHVFRKW